MSDILQIILIVVLALVYFSIGAFLSGAFSDSEDIIFDIVCILLWPAIIVGGLAFAVAWIMMSVTYIPIDFLKGLGNKLRCKIENLFKKKKESKTSQLKNLEQDTICDKCKYLGFCIEDERVLNVTSLGDSKQHYIRGFRSRCKKEEDALKLYEEMRGEEKSDE